MSNSFVAEDQTVEIVQGTIQELQVVSAPSAVQAVTSMPQAVQDVTGSIGQTIELITPAAEIVQVALIKEGPPGPSGETEPESGEIIRNPDGTIASVSLESKTVTLLRDENGILSGVDDGNHTWTISRLPDGTIESWEVT